MGREGRAGMGIADRAVIFVAWIATCGLVYLLGLYVGKGTQEQRLGLEERVVRLPVTSQPPPEGGRPKSDDEFMFYDKLMAGERPAVEPREPPKPAPSDAARPAPAAPTSVAHAPRPPSPTAPSAKPAPPVAVPLPTAAAKPVPNPTPGRASTLPPARLPAEPPPAVASGEPPPAVAVRPPLPSPVAAQPAAPPVGGWTVLASPTRSREEADALLRQLRGRGYEATLVRVVRDGDTWYRVHVGRFASADEASQVMHRLREREGVTHAFVASE